jgi:hypothetical protein
MFRNFFFAAILFSAMTFAQGPGNPNANVNSTEVLPDHRVVFRIYAPNAKEVSVNGEFGIPSRGDKIG